jgi:hypothetical protein
MMGTPLSLCQRFWAAGKILWAGLIVVFWIESTVIKERASETAKRKWLAVVGVVAASPRLTNYFRGKVRSVLESFFLTC